MPTPSHELCDAEGADRHGARPPSPHTAARRPHASPLPPPHVARRRGRRDRRGRRAANVAPGAADAHSSPSAGAPDGDEASLLPEGEWLRPCDGASGSDGALPNAGDAYIDASGALQLPAGIADVRGGAIVLRAFAPSRFPSRACVVPLPERAPPPTGRFDWVSGVFRFACVNAPPPPSPLMALTTPSAASDMRHPAPATSARTAAPPTDADAGAGADADADADQASTLAVRPASRIVYSVDPLGLAPPLSGPYALVYDDAVGVPLPGGASGFLERLSEREPPSVVTAIALVSGMWPSEPARFSAPHMLPPPPSGAHLDAASGILTMGRAAARGRVPLHARWHRTDTRIAVLHVAGPAAAARLLRRPSRGSAAAPRQGLPSSCRPLRGALDAPQSHTGRPRRLRRCGAATELPPPARRAGAWSWRR